MDTSQKTLPPPAKNAGHKSVPGGLYITFEGPEGCGKTTQLRMLRERLAAEGYSVVATKQPGGTAVGAAIRQILLHPDNAGKILPKTESLLFWADRYQHHEEIVKPALANNTIVLGDRDFDSSWVYQCAGRGIEETWMHRIHDSTIGGFKPQKTILLDAPVEKLLMRARFRNSHDISISESRFDDEEISFHERVRQAFLKRAHAEPSRFVIFNALTGASEMHEQIYAFVKSLIKNQED